MIPPSEYQLLALPFDSKLESSSELLSSGEPLKNSLLLLRFAILLWGVVRVLVLENYQCVAGGILILVGEEGDYFCDGIKSFIAIFVCFLAFFYLAPDVEKG